MEKEAPSTLLWTLFFLAQVRGNSLVFRFILPASFTKQFLLVQHYDRRGQYETSLSKIDEAIEHTPTVIDLYSVKVCTDL